MSKKEQSSEKLDYSKYTFRPEVKLEIDPRTVENTRQVVQMLLNDNTETTTKARYDWVHKETSKVAKKGISQEELKKNYTKVFSQDRTMMSEPEVSFNEKAKAAMSILISLDQLHRDNVDAGKGVLIEDFRAEMNAKMNVVKG